MSARKLIHVIKMQFVQIHSDPTLANANTATLGMANRVFGIEVSHKQKLAE